MKHLWMACLLALPALGDVHKGQAAALFDLPGLDGQRVKLEALRGKVVLLDFWASWCAPCKEELPELGKLAAEYRQKGVEVVTINVDSDRASAAELVKRLKLTLRVGLDPRGDKAAGQYGPETIPASYIIDRRGIVRAIHNGFRGADDLAKFREEIDALLRS